MRMSDWSSDVCSSDLESDCGGDVAQVFDAPFGELVLDRDAEGDVAQEFLPHKTDVGQELITAEYLLFWPFVDDLADPFAPVSILIFGHAISALGEVLISMEIGRASCRKGCVSKCRSRRSPLYSKKKKNK